MKYFRPIHSKALNKKKTMIPHQPKSLQKVISRLCPGKQTQLTVIYVKGC